MKTAFPSLQQTVKITLYSNIPFDNTYKNHSLISDLFKYDDSKIYSGSSSFGLAKERFINREKRGGGYYYPRYVLTGDFNFDYSNGLLTTLTMELTPAQTNANYMKVVCGTDIYYYFITGINQVNYDTYKLSLELDVLMTYQDEFLEGIKDMPVFTVRKHCARYTNDGIYPHSADLRTGDSLFAGVKANIVKNMQQLHFDCTNGHLLDGIKWLYVCNDTNFSTPLGFTPNYSFKGVTHPLTMLCLPISANQVTITDGNTSFTTTKTRMMNVINSLISDGSIKGCKISSYPPFNVNQVTNVSVSTNNYTITLPANSLNVVSSNPRIIDWDNNKTTLKVFELNSDPTLFILEEKNGDYDFADIEIEDLENGSTPSNNSLRLSDPKLLFNPFRKYFIASSYSSGNEFFPELVYSEGVRKSSYFSFAGVYTSYIGDYNIFTYVKPILDSFYVEIYSGYKENNIGLSSMVNYNIPSGTSALEVFNSTQAQSFYTSKVASGVTSGLTIAGGIASIIAGVAVTGGTAGTGAGLGTGMIVGGASAIASGTAGIATTIKSSVAKIEDLKNTPDAINVQGGSFVGDYARVETLPFIITYNCSEVVLHQADDYFYQYGYEVARDCYFNTEMKYDNEQRSGVDTNLFGRSLFNYIQIRDDITNKINSDIPLIVKQKLSKIFNDGITLWSLFYNLSLWGNASVTNANNPDKWFMAHTYDNTELTIIRES